MKNSEEIAKVKEWIVKAEQTLAILVERGAEYEKYIQQQKNHINNYNEILGHLGHCDCRYSKAMNQSSPRLCVDCGKPEEMVFVQTPFQLELQQKNCNHIYSRGINEPRPRLCEHCKQPEPERK